MIDKVYCTVCSMNVPIGTSCSDPDCTQLNNSDYIEDEFQDPEKMDFEYSNRAMRYERGVDTTEDIEFSDVGDDSEEHF